MITDILLATKLHLPTARPNQVSRPRLIAQLDEGLRLGHRLTLVSAPPGFGKTTLIREWADVIERRVAWLAVDEEDNEAGRFVSYVFAALHRADDRIGPGLIRPGQAARPTDLITSLINSLAEVGAGLLLVLDDYHLITNLAVHELLAFLVEKQPPTLHIVLGTREDPPLPLARLRARDQITEIRERDLRFTGEEASAFLIQTMGLGLSAQAVAALESRTEGWITGLQLAGLALRQQSAADAFVAAFAGDDRYIVDYLMAEVLNREPKPLRDFLRQTSILDRLSASLCNALTGRDDAQAILEQLDGANLFIIPLDNRREWYRYHVLFADVLRLTLAEAERHELHQRAASWFQAHGYDELAAHHARMVNQTSGAPHAPEHHLSGFPLVEPLSERELEILRLIIEGYSNAEIAQRLYITLGTVKTHINNLYGKLGVGSRTQAIAKARDLGLSR